MMGMVVLHRSTVIDAPGVIVPYRDLRVGCGPLSIGPCNLRLTGDGVAFRSRSGTCFSSTSWFPDPRRPQAPLVTAWPSGPITAAFRLYPSSVLIVSDHWRLSYPPVPSCTWFFHVLVSGSQTPSSASRYRLAVRTDNRCFSIVPILGFDRL